MKVLAVGYSKTGTKTIDSALETLGFKVFEARRCLDELSSKWQLFFDGKGSLEDLRQMYKGYDATSDMPAFHYWRQFVEAYPDLKLILMERDDDSFLRSWKTQVERSDKDFSVPSLVSPTARNYVKFWNACMKVIIPQPAPTSSFFKRCPHYDDDVILKSYRDHNKDVIENAPKHRLLRYSVKEGWAPLCAFLDKEVPEIPFPHRNKSGSINDCYAIPMELRNITIYLMLMIGVVFSLLKLFGIL